MAMTSLISTPMLQSTMRSWMKLSARTQRTLLFGVDIEKTFVVSANGSSSKVFHFSKCTAVSQPLSERISDYSFKTVIDPSFLSGTRLSAEKEKIIAEHMRLYFSRLLQMPSTSVREKSGALKSGDTPSPLSASERVERSMIATGRSSMEKFRWPMTLAVVACVTC